MQPYFEAGADGEHKMDDTISASKPPFLRQEFLISILIKSAAYLPTSIDPQAEASVHVRERNVPP
jgi:hypothetical protein